MSSGDKPHGVPCAEWTYLDWAASAPPDPAALQEALEVSRTCFANPSSPHGAGKEAEERLLQVRQRFAQAIGAKPQEVVFTSGGSESNAAVLLSLIGRQRLGAVEQRQPRVVISAIEHSSVYEQARMLEGHGIRCTAVRPRADGALDPQELADALDESTLVVSVMLVNNETGAIQKIPEISVAVSEFSARHGRRILVHTDAVQALGKVPLSVASLGVDAASFSGHKFGGPRGVGALWIRSGVSPTFLGAGGEQEGGRRPGTENVPGIAAMTVALERRMARQQQELASARENEARLLAGLMSLPGAQVFPQGRRPGGPFSPYIVCAGFPPVPAEIIVRIADARGFCISTGAACSSRKKDRTRVAESMGLSHRTALSVVRISTGHSTTTAQIDGLLGVLQKETPALVSMAGGRTA